MGLIDADVLKKKIREGGKIVIDEDILGCDSVHDILVYLLERIEDTVIQMIDEQPTAFEVFDILGKGGKNDNR